jgi:hypothetical protein
LPVNSRHPDYDHWIADWTMMRHAIAGDRIVKQEGPLYLPMPDGFGASNDPMRLYMQYKLRAQFPRITAPTLRGMLGVIHRKEADIKLPKALDPLWEKGHPGRTAAGSPAQAHYP